MKLNYYARLNDKGICTEIISTKSNITNIKDYINIPDYNESLLYRKWDGIQWSQQTYEPKLDLVLQEKISKLEKNNQELKTKYTEALTEIDTLKSNNNINLIALMEVNARLRELERSEIND